MLLQEISIPVAFVRSAIDGARRQGYDTRLLLKQNGIPPILLDRPQARVPVEAFIKLQQQLIREMNDESMGLASNPQPAGTFSLLAHAVLHGAHLGEVLQEFARFSNVLGGDFGAGFYDKPDSVSYHLQRKHPRSDSNPFYVESLTMTLFRYLCWLCRARVPLRAVYFDYPAPPWSAEYRGMFYGVPVHFNARTIALEFDPSINKLPVQRDARSLKGFIARAPRDLFVPTAEYSLSGRIRQRILRHMEGPGGVPTMEAVADHLDLHPQTLRRRLKAEKTDYTEIRDSARRDIALRLLTDGSMGISAIAEHLGYAESGAFSRAFKQWTGMTPLRFRQI